MSSFTETEAFAYLGRLFPGGLRDPALLAELCPDGWDKSPLCACFHPPAERQYEEHLAFRRNLARLRGLRKKDHADPTEEEEPAKTYEEFLREIGPQQPPAGEALMEEPAELLGLCLWDVFSDNHKVIAADGRVVDLGSFRGSAGVIADFFDRGPSPKDEDGRWREGNYMNFYMGTAMISGRADLTPVYRLIFSRLNALGATWRYAFPRIHVIDPGPRDEAETDYDPSAALAKEAERKQRADELRRTRKRLDRDVMAAKREARRNEAPATVRAYQEIHGHFPEGWPPDPYTPD